MNISEVIVSNNSIKMKVSGSLTNNQDLIGPVCKIHFIEYQLEAYKNMNRTHWSLFIRIKKCVDDGLLHNLTVTSTNLNLSKTFVSGDSERHLLSFILLTNFNFEIEIKVDVKTPNDVKFLDVDLLTILEIKGIDGSIHVHEGVLAAASEVFRQMITSDFKEKKEGKVELPYSICVLQDLKKYLYLNTLNNENLENLLMLAHCYMMDELKQKCINMLFFNTNTKKLENVQEKKDNGEGERQMKE